LILPNEANVLEWVRLWIMLMDKVLAVRVRQFVTWLRSAGIGFVLGVLGALGWGLDAETAQSEARWQGDGQPFMVDRRWAVTAAATAEVNAL
jgi:hypothetical protein